MESVGPSLRQGLWPYFKYATISLCIELHYHLNALQLMANFRASSSTPVWISYRAIGSGGGQAEFVGADNE